MKVFGVYKRLEGTAVKPALSPLDGSVSGSVSTVESPLLRRRERTRFFVDGKVFNSNFPSQSVLSTTIRSADDGMPIKTRTKLCEKKQKKQSLRCQVDSATKKVTLKGTSEIAVKRLVSRVLCGLFLGFPRPLLDASHNRREASWLVPSANTERTRGRVLGRDENVKA